MWNNLSPSPWNPGDLGLTFRRTWLCRWSGRHVSHSAISGKNSTDKAILQSKLVCSLSLQRPRWFTDVNAPTALPITISGKELAGLSRNLISSDNGAKKDTKARLNNAGSAFSILRSGLKAALVRLFFWKWWKVKKGDMRKSHLSKNLR